MSYLKKKDNIHRAFLSACHCGLRVDDVMDSGTILITAGVDLYTAGKLMGHTDVRTTQIYAKIVDSKKIEAVNMMDKMFEQAESDR